VRRADYRCLWCVTMEARPTAWEVECEAAGLTEDLDGQNAANRHDGNGRGGEAGHVHLLLPSLPWAIRGLGYSDNKARCFAPREFTLTPGDRTYRLVNV
jgi:hypothetical protein